MERRAELTKDSGEDDYEAACGPQPACRARGGPELAARAMERRSKKASSAHEAACGALPAGGERVGRELAARTMALLAELAKGPEWTSASQLAKRRRPAGRWAAQT